MAQKKLLIILIAKCNLKICFVGNKNQPTIPQKSLIHLLGTKSPNPIVVIVIKQK